MATPERVASGVYRVDAIGMSNAISILLLEDRDGFALVDTGLESSAGRIWEALDWLGWIPEDLKRIYITHHHPDHIGGLPGVLEWASDAEVVAPEHEAEIVSGERKPDSASSPILRFVSRFQTLPTVRWTAWHTRETWWRPFA
jgi:glyoxylase-like metal-dependent hydrolase (beta-lactamase superfamily II)